MGLKKVESMRDLSRSVAPGLCCAPYHRSLQTLVLLVSLFCLFQERVKINHRGCFLQSATWVTLIIFWGRAVIMATSQAFLYGIFVVTSRARQCRAQVRTRVWGSEALKTGGGDKRFPGFWAQILRGEGQIRHVPHCRESDGPLCDFSTPHFWAGCVF